MTEEMNEWPHRLYSTSVRCHASDHKQKPASGGPYAGGGGRHMKNRSMPSKELQLDLSAHRGKAKLYLNYTAVFRDVLRG